NGKEYSLATNNGPNALHGGIKGFDKVVWHANPFQSGLGPALELHYVSKDGEEGYPGNLTVTAIYTLTEDNGLRLDYTAKTDQDTFLNRPAAGFWKYFQPSQACNSTPEIFSMGQSQAKAARSITSATPFAWSRNIFPIHPINRSSPRWCSSPARFTRTRSFTGSRLN